MSEIAVPAGIALICALAFIFKIGSWGKQSQAERKRGINS